MGDARPSRLPSGRTCRGARYARPDPVHRSRGGRSVLLEVDGCEPRSARRHDGRSGPVPRSRSPRAARDRSRRRPVRCGTTSAPLPRSAHINLRAVEFAYPTRWHLRGRRRRRAPAWRSSTRARRTTPSSRSAGEGFGEVEIDDDSIVGVRSPRLVRARSRSRPPNRSSSTARTSASPDRPGRVADHGRVARAHVHLRERRRGHLPGDRDDVRGRGPPWRGLRLPPRGRDRGRRGDGRVRGPPFPPRLAPLGAGP